MRLKSLKDYLKDSSYLKIAALFGIGILLIFFGMGENGSVSATSEAVTLEEEIAALCSSLDGVGECRVLITYEEEPLGFGQGTEEIISGIAVVCTGGDNAEVRERVVKMLSGLFGIGTNRVRVERLASAN